MNEADKKVFCGLALERNEKSGEGWQYWTSCFVDTSPQ